MAAQRTISLRLGLEQAAEVKAGLESLGATGSATFDRLSAGLQKLGATDSSAIVGALERITRAAQAAQAATGQAAANQFAGVQGPSSVDDYSKRAADVQAYGAQLDALRAKFNPLFAASKQYETTLAEIGQAEKVGAISAAEAAAARDRVTASYAQSNAPLVAGTAATKANSDALRDSAVSAGNAAFAQRQLGVQLVQFFSSVEGGQSIITAFVQQGHQIGDVALSTGTGLRGIGTAAAGLFTAVGGLPTLLTVGVVGGIVAVGVAAESQGRRLVDLQEQLRATHDGYQALAVATEDAARRAAASSTLTATAARQAAQAISSAPYFSGTSDDIERLTKLSADLARVWNTDVATAAGKLRDAINDPAAAAKKFADEGLPGFNDALTRTVTALQASGRGSEALQAVLTTLQSKFKGAADDGTPLQKALHDLSLAFSGAETDGKGFANSIGSVVTSAATLAVEALTGVLNKLNVAIDALAKASKAVQPSIDAEIAAQNAALAGVMNRGGSSTVSAGRITSFADLPASAQGFIGSAASQYRVDPNLAARLYGAEAVLNPDGSYKDSPTGPIGPFQVARTTFNQMPDFAGQNIRDNQVNANAGLSLFSKLLDKYGDVVLAVVAYHDGETLVDHVLNGDTNRTTGEPYAPSQAALDEAQRVTKGYSGTGRGSGVNPNVTSATVGAGGDLLSAPIGGGFAGGIRNDTAANVDAADKERAALNLLADARQKLIESRDKFQSALDDPNAHLSAEQVTAYKAAIADLNGKLNDAITPAQAYIRSLKDQGAAAAAETAGDKALADVRQHLAELERSTGVAVTPAERAQAEAQAIDNLSASLRATEADLTRQTANQTALAAAYDHGDQAVLTATATQQAYQVLLQKFPQDSAAIQAALPDLTAKYEALARSAAEVGVAQQNAAARDNLDILAAESATLGQNADQRTKLIAVMRAEQDMHRKFGDVLPQEAQDYIDLTARTADATATYQHQQQALNDLTSAIGSVADTITNDITQAFINGNGAAVNWGNIFQGIESQIAGLIAKLLIVNPLLNALDGGSRSTFASVGGILGNLFGNSAGGDLVTAAAATGGSVATLAGAFDRSAATNAALGNTGTYGVATADQVAAAGGGGGSGLSAGVGLLGVGSKLLGGSSLTSGLSNFVSSIGNTIANYAAGALSNLVGSTVASTATNLALNAAGPGIYGVETAGQFAAGVGVTEASAAGLTGAATDAAVSAAASGAGAAGTEAAATAAIGTATSTIATALPLIGAGITVVSDLIQGNYRGAGLVAGGTAVGAAIGSIVPGIGTAIGAAVGAVVGGLIDAVFPQHPKNPYQDTEVDVVGGHVRSGKVVSQLENSDAAQASVDEFGKQLDDYMSKVGIVITNADSTIGHVGDHIKGLTQVDNVGALFKTLNFANDPNDTSNFGVAKGALVGMNFNSIGDLNTELAKIAAFSDSMSALGIKLNSVGTDLTNISVASVSLTGALQEQAAATSADGTTAVGGTAYDPSTPQSQLRIALAHDLPGQSFANVDALSAEIDKVNQFVNGTIPGLLNPILKSTSQLQQQIADTNQTYGQAIIQAQKYGLETQALIDAQTKADNLILADGRKQLDQQVSGFQSRAIVASGVDPTTAFQATFAVDQIKRDQERDAFIKSLTDVYGDSVKSTQYFLDSVSTLNGALFNEAQSSIDAFNRQQQTNALSIQATVASVHARGYAAQGDQQTSDLINFDAKAAQERDSYANQLTSAFGSAYAQTADYQQALVDLETVQQEERANIVTRYAQAGTQAVQTAAQAQATLAQQIAAQAQQISQQLATGVSVASVHARGAAAQGDQQAADLINFDAKALQEQYTYTQQLIATYGDSYAQTADYQQALVDLETIQQEERAGIVKKYADQATQAVQAAAQQQAQALSQAQNNVSSLFDNLTSYAQKLKVGADSPLSPLDQYAAASSQFNAVSGAAAAGDYSSASKLTTYADALISSSRAVNGSGVGYSQDVARVLDALGNVSTASDALTTSALRQIQQEATAKTVDAISALQDEVRLLRREIAQQARAA